MHILIINHYAGSPYHGMEYRPYYLAKEWEKLGHTTTIVAATQSHIRTKNPHNKLKVTDENINGIKYVWVKTRDYSGNGIGRVLNMLDFLKGVRAIISVLANEKPDAVIASSTYPLDNYLAWKIAKKSGAKYVYEVHDLWPLSPMEIGGYSKFHPFIIAMQWAEDFAYARVDKVISILPHAEEYMIKHGLKSEKFVHIPNGVSVDEFSDMEQLDEKIKSQIPHDKFIVGYTGTFGPANSLDTLLEAAAIIQERNDDIFFVLIGGGSEMENLIKIRKKLALANTVILDKIPKRQVQNALSLFTISIIAWKNKPSLYHFGVSPNKIFEYMYAGKPIIQAIQAGNDLVHDAACGLTITPQNPWAMADAIVELYNMSKEKHEEMGRNAKQYVLKNHTYEYLSIKFIDSLR